MARRQTRVSFPGSSGEQLAATLRMPAGTPRAFAVFAHCFTCGKDSLAASRISAALAERGIAVLRFDFTGLGGSEGDFANTNFTSNVRDLVAAARWLEAEHEPPSLLVGHSLGGTAVLMAAGQLESVRAVATLGAPSAPGHVIAQFGDQLETIRREGAAEVTLGGRPFRIEAQFVEDAEQQPLDEAVRRLRRALLIMHSPTDDVVRIDEATKLFTAALHPKSFVSLDHADHLLTRREDAAWAAEVIASWASRFLPATERRERPSLAKGEVAVREDDRAFLRSIYTDDHDLHADEPLAVGGSNRGPDPYEFLLSALGACTSMTVRMYANRKEWPLEDIVVKLAHGREYAADCADCETREGQVGVITREIRLDGPLTEEQRTRLIEIADRCPVHRTLENEIRIRTRAV